MDVLEFLQILFCCMFPLQKRRKTRTFVSAPLRRPRRTRVLVRRGPDKYQSLLWLQSRANYNDIRNKIFSSIIFDIANTLVVWCPQTVVSNDFISTMLHQFGEVLLYVDKWTCANNNVLGMWAGTIVQYSSIEEATLALKVLPMKCRHIKVIPLHYVLCLLIDCELLYGNFGQRHSSRVIISGKRAPRNEGMFSLHFDLSTFGAIEKIFFNYRFSPGVIGEVTYPYLTQAYLATMLLEGSTYDQVVLSATIDESPRDEEILEDAKRCLMFVTESYFPQ